MSKFKLNAESAERMGAEGGGGDMDDAGEAETSISPIDKFISQTYTFASNLGDEITYPQFQEIIFRLETVISIIDKTVGQKYTELGALYDYLQVFVNGFFEESQLSEQDMSEIVDYIKAQFQSKMQRYLDEKKFINIDNLADIFGNIKFDEGNTEEMEADGMDVDAPTPAPTMAPTVAPTMAPTAEPTSSAANRRPLHNGISSVRAIIRAAAAARQEVEKVVAEKAAAEKAAAACTEDPDSDVEYEYETTEAPTMAPTIAPTVAPTIENPVLSIAGSVDCFFDILK